MGPSGAGKSTIFNLLLRFYDVESGSILIDGQDIARVTLDSLRATIALVTQEPFLFDETIAENIAYGRRDALREEIIEAARAAAADGFVAELTDSYDSRIGEGGLKLSGGQRQRIAIARALLTDPSILVLDDSTSAIDSATEDEIQKAIHRLLQGRTTLLITHRLSQIRWADKILVLKRGELIDQGTHAELLERCDMYRRIFAHHGRETRPLHLEYPPVDDIGAGALRATPGYPAWGDNR